MSQPGDSVVQHFLVLTSADVPVTGLTGASFTFTSYVGTAAVAWAPTVTEIGLGWYALTYTLPTATTAFSRYIVPVSSANLLTWPSIVGEVEAADLDSIRAALVRPIATTDANFGPANSLTFAYVAGDSRPISFTVTDSAGVGIDLTTYSAFGFGVRSADGTTTVDTLTALTGSSLGVVELTLLGSENFQTIADGLASVDMHWDFQATLTSSSKKYTLARGILKVLRQEYRA